ncbi:WD repeat-containing protein [Reticulomyxa filosa]|uniref:WD repeat-containing protein n=1 Tax=Reticulomyxa filosa TaxID=46433 RepID=X6NWR0_RETFI|nr:WD repeat-containing protein [Reticulomyxa filosa]|eukprot:ETO29727.1 WD repeat-containing protein [Reticulomyxa filosa]
MQKLTKNILHHSHHRIEAQEKTAEVGKMGNPISKPVSSIRQSVINLSTEEETEIIIKYWVRISNIKLGWIYDFDRLVVKYATNFFVFEVFRSSSKLIKTFTGHTSWVNSIDYSTFDCGQFICSGSDDKTVCVWDVETNKQIQSFNGHSDYVYCVKFSQYHHYNNCRSVICCLSLGKTIRFWDVKHNKQLQICNDHTDCVCGMEFSSFSNGRYLCSGSFDNTIRLWDMETSKSLHVFSGHTRAVRCVDISPLQSNSSNKNDNNKSGIGAIGGNGYTICSGSYDKTICIWDIETTKQSITFKGHENWIASVKYGSNELGISNCANTILSGSFDNSVRLWDIRSGQQIQVFNRHDGYVYAVEYSSFVVNNIEVGDSTNVVCSGSSDNTVRFWDIRSNKNELYVIKGNNEEDNGILCLKFLQFKQNRKGSNDNGRGINLCYGSSKGSIYIWG